MGGCSKPCLNAPVGLLLLLPGFFGHCSSSSGVAKIPVLGDMKTTSTPLPKAPVTNQGTGMIPPKLDWGEPMTSLASLTEQCVGDYGQGHTSSQGATLEGLYPLYSQAHPREGDQDELFVNLKFLWSHTDPAADMHSCDYKSGGGPELSE